MQSAGEILKKARLQKKLTLPEVSKTTKIPVDSLEKIEAGDYWSLPSETYTKGFLKNYARFLAINPEKILAFFRREYKKPIRKSGRLAWLPASYKSLTITPTAILAGLGTILILSFLAFLAWQYKNFAGTPLLVLVAPTDQQELTRPMVTVIGKSDPDAKVLVNGEAVQLSENGNFQKMIDLEKGVHIITVIATNQLGKTTTIKRTVVVKPSSTRP